MFDRKVARQSARVSAAHILVVDDQQENIEHFETTLDELGYRISAARNGLEALDKVKADPPDLVIMDVMMPGMDGLEATRTLKADSKTRPIPVLMVTGLSDLGNKVDGLEAGADDFLGKPFNRVELVARVRSLLRIKALHDELEKKNELLGQVLDRFMSVEVARELLRDPERNLKLGGHSCRVSVMFADIRGFTAFSESRSAAQVVEVLNEVFSSLSPIVLEYGGTLDKYLGDAIMAFFGAPMSSADDAPRAARAAFTMQKKFNALLKSDNRMSGLALGIGIGTGEAVVGNVGSEHVMDYTVIGNVPNTASRLQSVAAGGQTLIDDETYEAVNHLASVRPTKPLVLKGRSEPVQAYELLSVR